MALSGILVVLSIVLMLAYILSELKVAGALAWLAFSLVWLLKIPYYLSISDYYNVIISFLAFFFFAGLAISILRKNSSVFVEVTGFSVLAIIAYFLFALTSLGRILIAIVSSQTAFIGSILGFKMTSDGFHVYANSRKVEIVLACTGIESMALFFGATMGLRAEWKRKLKAFAVSVPVIYILNLLRNVFVAASYAYSWFGENSFYIAHHVISKVLATIALILISFAVFRFLPELEELIFSLKEAMKEAMVGR